jgi:hypothetical protein
MEKGKTMKSVIRLSLAGLLAFALTGAWPGAATAVPLTLTGVQDNTLGPQSTSNPCIIAATTCQQPAGFGYNNFTANGGTSSYNMYSTATNPPPGVPDGVQGTPYTVSQLPTSFVVAIDVNTTSAASETLQLFEVIVNGAVAYNYVGPTVIGGISNNGNGYGDWSLGTIDLSGFASNATVLFHAVWNNAVDGGESFFIQSTSSPVPIPEPSTIVLLGSMLVGLSLIRFRRQ